MNSLNDTGVNPTISWSVIKAGAVFASSTKRAEPNAEVLAATQTKGVYPQKLLIEETGNSLMLALSGTENFKKVKKGDFVISLRSFQGGIESSNFDGGVSPAYTVLHPIREINTKFFKYYFKSHRFISRLNATTVGIRDGKNIKYDDFKLLQIPIPDYSIQEKVANYLDQKVARIDEAIVKKKKLIALLSEKRTAVINDTVQEVKGRKTKIKHISTINPVTRNNFKFLETVSFVPMEAVSEYGIVSLQERKIQDVISGYTYFEENDVVIAKITPCFENGKAGVMKGLINGFGFGTTEFIVLRSESKILPQYLYYLIFSGHFRENGTNEMRGTAGQKRLTESYIGHYTFNLPNLEEQEKIIRSIYDAVSKIDNAKNKITESINLLEEYKTSLISNAVTGKVKI